MSSGLYIWSQTAASNANADTTINWAEGQAPSTVNDSARAMMAGIAKYRDDLACGIATGGTSTAYTVSSNQVFDTLAHMHNQLIGFVPNATSTNAVAVDVTLNVDGLGAKPIRAQPGVTLPTGTLVLGTPYVVTYNNTDGVFYLHSMTNPYVIPLGCGMDYWGSSTPNSCFAFPTGQAISRTTYASLFSLLGTTYGSGDGSTTFNLPDKTGRVSAMKEAAATRLTSTYFGGNSTTLGATGGSQSYTLARSDLPNVIPTVSGNGTINLNQGNIVQSGGLSGGVTIGGAGSGIALNSGASPPPGIIQPTVTINIGVQSLNGGVSQTNAATVPPTIVCNYIIRII